jgi:hypothetical protein
MRMPFMGHRRVPIRVAGRVHMARPLTGRELRAAISAHYWRQAVRIYGDDPAQIASLSWRAKIEAEGAFRAWRAQTDADPSLRADDEELLAMAGLGERAEGWDAATRRAAAREVWRISAWGGLSNRDILTRYHT